ncbi:MAG TPA: choice-of-anchor Q domain-containing protein, partial [Agitococcus sp.]|nr:choice-of-anchor Q domain-containing protein [Agitococcus sp.]
NQYITVTFNNIDFLGCDNNCATNGGIILNKEFLTITNSVIAKGVASEKGGAIYNAANSVLSIKNAVIKNNRAESGSAIFSEDANLALSSSLITDNQTTNINNGVITLNKTLKASPYAPITPLIENSTISGNKGIGLNIQEGILVNTSTVVQNTVGISFNSGLPTVYNSIIADNSTLDCQSFAPIPADNKAYFANNLSVKDKGCPTTNVFNSLLISNTGAETLMAATDSKGHCAAPPAVGLLCPLANNGGLTRTHKPRLLASYTKLNDSVIVNKGFNVNKNSAGLACSSLDQRGKPRENNENACDIGAVELISGLSSSRQGDDIVFGQIKRFSPLENLGDAELLPAELCANFLGAGEYINGCIRVIDLPRHGQASIDTQTGELLYSTTKTDFHGFDTFSYGVITTLSRFNDANNDRTLTTSVRVVSEPPSSPPSKALDNGANGIFSILMLSLVAIWRRIYRGQ